MAYTIRLPDDAEMDGHEHRATDAVVLLLEMVFGEDRVEVDPGFEAEA